MLRCLCLQPLWLLQHTYFRPSCQTAAVRIPKKSLLSAGDEANINETQTRGGDICEKENNCGNPVAPAAGRRLCTAGLCQFRPAALERHGRYRRGRDGRGLPHRGGERTSDLRCAGIPGAVLSGYGQLPCLYRESHGGIHLP